MKPIRVLVVDDSLLMRRSLTSLLTGDPTITVVGTAENGAEALLKIAELRPDVVLLDVVMPVMDGLTALRHIMRDSPLPVVMVSAATRQGARETLDALALGAVDFVAKPSGPAALDLYAVRDELVQKIKTAYASHYPAIASIEATRARFQSVLQGLLPGDPRPAAPAAGALPAVSKKRLVAIAASTGGPVAIQRVVTALPGDLDAGLVILLHIAAGFIRPLVERLGELSRLAVYEATDGAQITPGVAWVAPIGVHTTVVRKNGQPTVRLTPEPANALHRPSADVLFDSIARCCADETCAVILTGMGNDGALGLRAIRQAGGYTIAQDEATSVVYGMPRRAVELDGVDVSLPIDQIAAEIIRVTANAERNYADYLAARP